MENAIKTGAINQNIHFKGINFGFYALLINDFYVFMNLIQFVWTMYKICKVRGLNTDVTKKKISIMILHTFATHTYLL